MLFPIKKLLEGRPAPLTASSDTTVRDALTLMVQNDYSQLPIINTEGALTGLISQETVVRRY